MNTSTPLGATRIQGHRVVFVLPTEDADTYSNGIDWVAVERAVHGEYESRDLTQQELREAALFLRRRGVARKAVSVQMCVYEQLVKQWEADAGMLGPEDLCNQPGCGKAIRGRGMCSAHLEYTRGLDRRRKKALAELEAAA